MLRDVLGPELFNMRIVPHTDKPEFDAEAWLLPGVTVMRGRHSPNVTTVFDPGRNNDDLMLVRSRGYCRGRLRHAGHEIEGNQEAAVLISCADPFHADSATDTHPLNIRVKRTLLGALLPDADDRLMRPIPPDHPALRLLEAYLEVLRGEAAPQTPALAQAAALHICDLIAVALGANGEARTLAAARGGRAARLAAVKHWVLTRLVEPGLSVRQAAAAQGVGPRSIQQLFEMDGTTFSTFVRSERLKLARRQLQTPLLAARPISAIAYDAGFSDLSYFNRAFRAAFGEAPSDARHKAQMAAV